MSASLYAVTFDCADAAALAAFWADVLDPPYTRPHWLFIQVPEVKTAKNRMHADLIVSASNLAAETSRLLGLGAVKLAEHEEDGSCWITLGDPEGNEFDVIEDGPEEQ